MTLNKTKIGLILTEKKGHYLEFIKKVWQLTTLKISPELLPYKRAYLLMGLGLNFVLAYFVVVLLPSGELKQALTPMLAISMKAVNLFFLGVFLYLILKFNQKTDRFFKLYLSIVAGTLLIETLNFILSLIPNLLKKGLDIDLSSNLGLALMFSLMVYITLAWMIVFMGHIFRHGLEISRFKGIWIGIGYILISGVCSVIIFGNPFEELMQP